jgi:hypothetical protein
MADANARIRISKESLTCLAGAEAIQDTKVKSVLLQLATGYKLMADRIEDADDTRSTRNGTQQSVKAD